jgi:hypothetical protein
MLLTKRAGSGAGFGLDPNLDLLVRGTDPGSGSLQNVTDPEHCL